MLTNLPFTLPAWMPGWVFLILLLPVLLWVLAFLLMPFSVFGVKGRLEAMEAQVDAMHEEMKMMAMRAAGVLPPAATDFDPHEEVPNFGRLKNSQREPFPPEPAPVKPGKFAPKKAQETEPEPTLTPLQVMRERLAPAPQNPPPRPPRRTEPRLD